MHLASIAKPAWLPEKDEKASTLFLLHSNSPFPHRTRIEKQFQERKSYSLILLNASKCAVVVVEEQISGPVFLDREPQQGILKEHHEHQIVRLSKENEIAGQILRFVAIGA